MFTLERVAFVHPVTWESLQLKTTLYTTALYFWAKTLRVKTVLQRLDACRRLKAIFNNILWQNLSFESFIMRKGLEGEH